MQNLFGLRTRPNYVGIQGLVVEDHTHDPLSHWAKETTADYAFASLRKTLPIPDGAVVWSHLHRDLLPHVPALPRDVEAVTDRVKAMLMQIDRDRSPDISDPPDKPSGTAFQQVIEQPPFAAMSAVSATLLTALPIHTWRRTRHRNASMLRIALRDAGFDVLRSLSDDAAPIGVVVDLHDAVTTKRIHHALQSERIHTAVLWPRPSDDASGGFADQHLVVYCDHRYDAADLRRVTAAMTAAIERK
ncbi:hypothetical protein ACIBCN_44130 [Nocardia sp. NPDC051052]|uniref:hypothetical protein n=1 Tax=Nocardia sp. NPDC051052 TaxID=3364322 RepID=UPI0037B84F26